jgi:endonuclease/exonuclease/phosphatase family metal-dependent hydrolase
MAGPGTTEFVAASFNVHGGVDGWGRPYDVLSVCRALDADVLVLQESWKPTGGVSTAAAVGDALGYQVTEVTLATGRRGLPHPDASTHWMRPLDWRTASHALYLDSERPLHPRTAASARYHAAEPGSWGIAVLSRLPVLSSKVLPLPRLRRDRATRAVVTLDVELGGRRLGVAGTHMSHLSHGSALHFRAVARMLEEVFGDEPVLFAGDMNLWGPPIHAFFGQWRRAVKGKTWPAWRPHSQLDHLLVRGLSVVGSGVWPESGSDHRPVWARLSLAAA